MQCVGDPYARMPSDSTGDLYAFQNAVNRPSISLSFYGKEWIDTEGLDERVVVSYETHP